MMGLKRLVAVPMLAGAIAVGATACEPTVQDGLVNVRIGDVTTSWPRSAASR
jgi:hypothetical protein